MAELSHTNRPLFLVLDIETTGLSELKDLDLDNINPSEWPRCVQIAWSLHENSGKCIENQDFIVKIDGFNIPHSAYKIHGISDELSHEEGHPIKKVLSELDKTLKKVDYLVGHNVGFDIGGISAEYSRIKRPHPFKKHQLVDTCSEQTKQLCRIEGGRGKGFKFPKLEELYQFLFHENITDSHNATRDVVATARCFFELLRTKNLTFSLTSELIDVMTEDQSMSFFPNQEQSTHQILNNLASKIEREFGGPVQSHQRKHENLRKKSESLKTKIKDFKTGVEVQEIDLEKVDFVHLHVHSHYSLLQATSKFSELVSAAAEDNMIAVACTDLGYMTGIFKFLKTLEQHNNKPSNKKKPIKPIIGCELNVCRNHLDQTRKDNGYQMVFLAKTLQGYRNLSKLVSIARTKGFYYVPRIDRELILKYKEDLIVLSGASNGELYSNILNRGDHFAIEALKWWKQQFNDDFYIEINRQGNQQEQSLTNNKLIELSLEYGVSLVACNNTFYTQKEDAELHEILLCIGQGSDLTTSIGNQRGMRFGYTHQEFYFKSQQEMKVLFSDIPQAILSTQEIANKIETFDIHRQVELPKFEIPIDFASKNENMDQENLANQYLKHIAYQGAEKFYDQLNQEIKDRLDYELNVIANTGYPGYFLILSDLVNQASKKGVDVGPGRGSAAGSIVAYCIGITKVDPLKYNLLFERFLNPDRISLPDIDIDFEDSGRSKVIDYLIDRYGADQVSQILTFSTLKAKNSILDVARVLALPINESRQLSDRIETFDLTLKERLTCSMATLKKHLSSSELKSTQELRSIYKGEDKSARTLQLASRLEGTNRNLSTHACGVIIAPEEITNFVPITKIKDSDLTATQFDNNHVEDAGLLKMDILGLTTLTSVKDAIRQIHQRHSQIDVDLENPPLDDQKTFKLFQDALTNGVFQYESPGMKKSLKDLKPSSFEDLVAVNALFRPGPLEYIPTYIARKQGKEAFVYDIPETEEILKETYGITVYQEQVMLLSQELAGFTKGEADLLRKAMGKKEKAIIDKLKPKFIDGGKQREISEEKLEKIWKDWESFARYAFNKSHSVSYALLGYKTAFLKAHYPAEYLSAIMTQNMSKPDKVTNYVIECQKFDVTVLGPDINESNRDFTVVGDNIIRFGLGGIKYLSSHAIEHVLELRNDGRFESVFDFMERINTKYCNKKSLTALICSGSFDSFETPHRAQYFTENGSGEPSLLDDLMKYSDKYAIQNSSDQPSLFDFEEIGVIRPQIHPCKQWSRSKALLKEKEYISLYLSAHPLDDFEYEMKYFGGLDIKYFSHQINHLIGKPSFWIGGIISDVFHRESRLGNTYANFKLGDKTGNYSFAIFGEQHQKFHSYLVEGSFVRIQLQIQKQNSKNSNYSGPRIHFRSFELLEDVFEKNINHIEIKTSLQELDTQRVSTIRSLFNDNPLGNTRLRFLITNQEAKEDQTHLSLSSKIDPFLVSTQLLKALDSMKIEYTFGQL